MPAALTAYAELGTRSNFSFLDGAFHPAELVATAAELGLSGLSTCDTNSLAGVVRGHVAVKKLRLSFTIGARLRLQDGSGYLAGPNDRASYGRLTTLLCRGRMDAPKEACELRRRGLLARAEGMVLAVLPPERPETAFVAWLREDPLALRDRLALPLHLAGWLPPSGTTAAG